MDFEGVNRTIDKDDDEEIPKPRDSDKNVHEFYFAKINELFIDCALEVRLESARKLKRKMLEERELYYATYVQPLEERLSLARIEGRHLPIYVPPPYWRLRSLIKDILRDRELLEKHWPETINEDIENDEPDPDLEVVEIREKMPKLFIELGHSQPNIVEEKRILQQLDRLHWRREKCDHEVREADAKIPRSTKRYHYGNERSKFDLKRSLRKRMKEVREEEEKENTVRRLHERAQKKIEALEKRIAPHEMICQSMKEEEQKVDEQISRMELSIQKQSALYEKYCSLINKARILASEKDLEALRKLSNKQVEAFMSKYASDETFRANYTRSIQLSLANRGLSNDGRIQDLSV